MTILISLPVLLLAMVVQTAVVSRINLLYGSGDLILVILAGWALQERVTASWLWAVIGGALVAYVSRLPWFVPLVGYLLVVGLARLLQRRVWHAPLLAMFIVCFFGSLAFHALSLFSLRFIGDPLPIADSFSLITLPSVLLDLLLAIPVYVLMRDLAGWLHPAVVES
jgi:hypothetical protein